MKNKTKIPSLAKERIKEAALRLFYKYGIQNVGIDKIILESNVAKMTLFNHFPTKKDLIIEYLICRDESFFIWIEKSLGELKDNGKSNILNFIDLICAWLKSEDFNGCAFINTTAVLTNENTIEKKICIDHKKKFNDFIFKLATEDGNEDANLFSDIFAVFIDGIIVKAHRDGHESAIILLKSGSQSLINVFFIK